MLSFLCCPDSAQQGALVAPIATTPSALPWPGAKASELLTLPPLLPHLPSNPDPRITSVTKSDCVSSWLQSSNGFPLLLEIKLKRVITSPDASQKLAPGPSPNSIPGLPGLQASSCPRTAPRSGMQGPGVSSCSLCPISPPSSHNGLPAPGLSSMSTPSGSLLAY